MHWYEFNKQVFWSYNPNFESLYGAICSLPLSKYPLKLQPSTFSLGVSVFFSKPLLLQHGYSVLSLRKSLWNTGSDFDNRWCINKWTEKEEFEL